MELTADWWLVGLAVCFTLAVAVGLWCLGRRDWQRAMACFTVAAVLAIAIIVRVQQLVDLLP